MRASLLPIIALSLRSATAAGFASVQLFSGGGCSGEVLASTGLTDNPTDCTPTKNGAIAHSYRFSNTGQEGAMYYHARTINKDQCTTDGGKPTPQLDGCYGMNAANGFFVKAIKSDWPGGNGPPGSSDSKKAGLGSSKMQKGAHGDGRGGTGLTKGKPKGHGKLGSSKAIGHGKGHSNVNGNAHVKGKGKPKGRGKGNNPPAADEAAAPVEEKGDTAEEKGDAVEEKRDAVSRVMARRFWA